MSRLVALNPIRVAINKSLLAEVRVADLSTLEFHDVALSESDLAKLKIDLPKVRLTFTPVTAEYREKWDVWAAKK